jgi:PPOX class probable F420-dependent enzyme
MNHSTRALEPFVGKWAVLLNTYKRDGTPVGTAVNIVVEGDHAYFRTWDTAWKLRRIRNNPEVEFAPSTPLGRPTAPAIQARARVLEGKESAHAGRLLARKYPAMHGLLVRLVHRLRGNKTMHVELIPDPGGLDMTVERERGASLTPNSPERSD